MATAAVVHRGRLSDLEPHRCRRHGPALCADVSLQTWCFTSRVVQGTREKRGERQERVRNRTTSTDDVEIVWSIFKKMFSILGSQFFSFGDASEISPTLFFLFAPLHHTDFPLLRTYVHGEYSGD